MEINRFGIIFDAEMVGKKVHRIGERTMNIVVGFGYYRINKYCGYLTVKLDNGKEEFVDNIDFVDM